MKCIALTRGASVVVVTLLLNACSTLPVIPRGGAPELSQNTLPAASKLLARADRMQLQPEAATVCRLRAAEIAWDRLLVAGTNDRAALALYNRATAAAATAVIGHSGSGSYRFDFGGCNYRLNVESARAGVWDAGGMEGVESAGKVRHRLCKNWYSSPGLGAPLVTEWKPESDKRLRPFVPDRGPIVPVTAVVKFPSRTGTVGRTAEMAFYDPSLVSVVEAGSRKLPLAYDFTAPIVGRTAAVKELRLGVQGLFDLSNRDAELSMMEPYDPNRLTIVLVHGLLSHPRMWRDVINDIAADPELRGKVQFWTFYYPTGWPISYSSLRFREELEKLQTILPGEERMVLVGHSMGGLLSRMQVIDTERVLWDGMLKENADRFYAKLPPGHIVKRALIYKHNPDIDRVVFICVPHRGSHMAEMSATIWVSKLIRLPSSIAGVLLDLADLKFEQRQLTSLYGLSPSNPLLKALDHVPIVVPYHSIIGDRGRGDTPNSSDGVVPYWSSHLDGAQSEVIVADNHGAFKHPMAIAELKRIIRQELAATPKKQR